MWRSIRRHAVHVRNAVRGRGVCVVERHYEKAGVMGILVVNINEIRKRSIKREAEAYIAIVPQRLSGMEDCVRPRSNRI